MTCAIYALIIFAALVLFVPTDNGELIRNAPLLIAILAVIAVYCIVKLVKFSVFAGRMKKLLISHGFEIKSSGLSFGSGGIIAESDFEVYDIRLLRRKKSYYRCHFNDENNVEYFKTTASAVRSGSAVSAKIVSGTASTRSVGKQTLKPLKYESPKPRSRFIIMDKYPSAVSDSVKRDPLGNGDFICISDVRLYDGDGFTRFTER